MPRICPRCLRSFSTAEFLGYGGLCPACKVILTAVGEPLDMLLPRVKPAEEGLPETSPDPLPQKPPGAARGLGIEAEAPDPEELVALAVSPLKGQVKDVASIIQLLNALAPDNPFSLEIAGTALHRYLIVRCLRKHAPAVSGQVTAIYGAPQIRELSGSEDPASLFRLSGKAVSTLRLDLAQPYALPLRTYEDLLENDTLLPILGALYGIGEGEACMSQILVQGPAPEDWAAAAKRELLFIKRAAGGAIPPRELLRRVLVFLGAGLVSLYILLGQWASAIWMPLLGMGLAAAGIKFFSGSGIRWSETLEDSVAQKIGQSAYRVEIRLAAAAASPDRAGELVTRLAGAYQVFGFEAGNTLVRSKSQTPFDPSVLTPHPQGVSILGDAEIAGLWHLPVGEPPDMLAASRVEDTLPDPAKVAASEENTWRLGSTGKAAGAHMPVFLPRAAITRTHAFFMGKTRTGKTTGLLNAIREIAREPGRAIVAIDPHDDMVRDLLGIIPAERTGDVIYINFTDGEQVPALNLLDVNLFDGDPERTAEALTEVTKALFKKYWGPRMEVVFERVALALALANSRRAPAQQFTILDAISLLNMGETARMEFLRSVLPEGHIQRDTLLSYFQWEFQELTKSMREQVIMPVLSKLRPFESNSHLLAVFGQPESTLNPIKAIREGKILLVRTGAAVLSHEYSNFIGSLFLNLVRRGVLAQAEEESSSRTNVTLVVDESQSFTGVDYAAALAEIAKFGGNLLLTTQGTRFIGRSSASDEPDDPHAFSKILANVDTLLIYRISGEDAVALAEGEFVGERRPADLIYLPDHQAFVRFKSEGEVIGPFRVEMDPAPRKDELVQAQILAGRGRYSLPLADALDGALRSARRMHEYYSSAAAAATAPQDGEIRGPAPAGVPPEVETLLADGLVGLGSGDLIETLDTLLGKVNTQEPEGE